MIAGYDEACCVVLKCDVIGVVAPVVKVCGEDPFALPVNCHIIEHGIKARIDVVCISFRKYNVSTVVTVLEGFDNPGYIVCRVRFPRIHRTCRSPVATAV